MAFMASMAIIRIDGGLAASIAAKHREEHTKIAIAAMLREERTV